MSPTTATIRTADGREAPFPSPEAEGLIGDALQKAFGSRGGMRETPEDRAVKTRLLSSAGEEIRSFVERYEALEAQKKEIASDMSEVMAEAKGRGYDTKILRKIIALRKRNAEDVAKEEAILELYKSALGMA